MLNNLPISLAEELADALQEMARDIALIEPDPQDWGGWVIYFIEQMEVEAKKRGKSGDYGEMLRSLKQDLDMNQFGLIYVVKYCTM